MRGRWVAVLGASAVAVVATGLPAIAAVPTTPTALTLERTVTHTPVLAATVTDADGGAVTTKFSARRAGSATWDLLNGASVAVTSGQVARAALPALPAGTAVQWQVQACDSTACSATTSIQNGVVSPMLGAGPRKGATGLPFTVGDRVAAQVDVGSGNLLADATGFSVGGVNGDLPVSLVYNSLSLGAGVAQASTSNLTGFGWRLNIGARLAPAPDGSIVLWGPSGLSGTFVPAAGGAFTPPAGLTADLVAAVGGGWTLTDHASQQKWTFDAQGRTTAITDRNANTHTIGYDPYNTDRPISVSATRGTNLAIGFGYTSGRLTSITQGGGANMRTVTLTYDANGDLASVKDAMNRTTTFTYSAHQLTKVAAPGGIDTRFTMDTRNRVTSVRQVNTTPGSPGDTWTRLAYPSETQVLVSDGAQEQSGSPTSGSRTTYTLTADKTGRVTTAVDAQGRSRGATFTANFDPATTTVGAGAGAGTTSFAYGANGGESLTSVTAPTGASRGFGYTNTAAATKHLPTSSTDDGAQTSLFTYNGAGNALTSADPLTNQAVVTRNTNGTVATATASGNGTNKTTYTYTNAQLTKITPVTGSSLGVRDFTYDPFGRLKTSTNGRGITSTYTYDVLDRVSGIDYSGTTANPDVSFTYDAAGRQHTRTDANGTTTFTYDQISNVRSRVNSFDNQTVAYTYDKAARLASTTDSAGTTNYSYDSAGALIAMEYPAPDGIRGTTKFAVDAQGRRTDTWMRANDGTARWAAHTHTDYDTNGRPTRVLGERRSAGSATSPITTVVDLTYCYAVSTYPTCSTTPSADRSLVQWRRDNLTGQLTTYTYDNARRLTGAAVTAGTASDGSALPATSYAYAYDARGNRTTATVNGVATTRTHNAANQITTTGFTYDGAGNLTTDPTAGAIAYTAGDQMASVTRSGTTYSYTYAGVGNGELVHHNTPDGTYAYTYGAQGSSRRPVIQQVTKSGSVAHLDNDPTGKPVQLRTSTGQDLLYVYDGLGSPVALITSSNTTAFQYSFDPYGVADLQQTSGGNATVQTPFLFTGGLDDRTTDWTLNTARYYNAGEGRWTQYDTLDAPLDPLNANRYAYAANNPVNYIDPTGQASYWDDLFGTAGRALDGIGIASTVGSFARGDTYGGAVGVASLAIGAVIGGACAGATAGLTGGAGIAAAGLCFGAGIAAGEGFTALAT